MPRNTRVTIGEHFSSFIDKKIEEDRFESTSEAVRECRPTFHLSINMLQNLSEPPTHM